MGRWRKYRRELHFDSICGHRHMEAHYTDMARRGWMLERLGAVTHRYRAAKPCDVRFCVDVLPDIGVYDYPHGDNALSYRAMCEDAGWELVAQHRQTHVFRAKDADSPPLMLHTDAREQNRINMRAYRKSELFGALLEVVALPLLVYFLMFRGNTAMFFSDLLFFVTIGLPFAVLSGILRSTMGFVWYLQSQWAFKRSQPPPVINRRLYRFVTGLHRFDMMALLICLIIGVVLQLHGGTSPVLVIFAIGIPMIGLIIGLGTRKKIDTQEHTKSENIARSIFRALGAGVLAMIVVLIAPQPRADFSAEQVNPAITLSALNMTQRTHIWAMEQSTSLIVPLHYTHQETNWNSNDGVHTTVQQSISTAVARRLFNDRVNQTLGWHYTIYLPRGADVRFRRMDGADAAAWGADEGVISVIMGESVLTKLRSGTTLVFVRVRSDAGVNMDLKRQAVLDLWSVLETRD